MSDLVAVLGVPHNPLLRRAMQAGIDDDLRATHENFQDFRGRLEDARPDVLIMVGSDHFRKFFYDNSPAFMIGKAPRFQGTHPNEIRTFGLDPMEVPGDVEMATSLLGTTFLNSDSIDFGFSNEWLIDHGWTVPLWFLRPQYDIPIVPIHSNTNMPPLPGPRRFAALGQYLREAIATDGSDKRVAIIATGHLATDIGGPRQFLGGDSPDPEFDADAVAWMASGDIEVAIEGCQFDRLASAGNVTLQFLNLLVGLAAADRVPDFAEGTASRFAVGPFFYWDMRGQP